MFIVVKFIVILLDENYKTQAFIVRIVHQHQNVLVILKLNTKWSFNYENKLYDQYLKNYEINIFKVVYFDLNDIFKLVK